MIEKKEKIAKITFGIKYSPPSPDKEESNIKSTDDKLKAQIYKSTKQLIN